MAVIYTSTILNICCLIMAQCFPESNYRALSIVKILVLVFNGFPIYDNDCLDMFFPYVSLHWGTAATIILTFAIIYAIIMAAIKHNTSMLLLLFFFLIYGCSETAHIYPVYSYFSLLLGYYIMNRKPLSLHIK